MLVIKLKNLDFLKNKNNEIPIQKKNNKTFSPHFIGKKIIEKKEKIKCWNCHQYIKTEMEHIPYIDSDFKEYTYGYFCSMQCSLTFNNHYKFGQWQCSEIKIRDKWRRKYTKNEKLNETPPFFLMKEYGGNMDKDEFKTYCTYTENLMFRKPYFCKNTKLTENLNTKLIEFKI